MGAPPVSIWEHGSAQRSIKWCGHNDGVMIVPIHMASLIISDDLFEHLHGPHW